MSVFGVFLIRIFPHSDWLRARKTPNTSIFHAVKPYLLSFHQIHFQSFSPFLSMISSILQQALRNNSRVKGSIGLNALSYWPLYARDISKGKKYDISGQKYADSQDYNSLVTLGLGKVLIIPVIKVWLEQHSSSVFVVDYQSFYACSVRYNASHIFVKFLWSLVYTL